LQVTLLFALEASLKLIAKGFAGYFQSKTESLDLFIAATSLTDELVGQSSVKPLIRLYAVVKPSC
jgi:hypothetical protein